MGFPNLNAGFVYVLEAKFDTPMAYQLIFNL